MRRIGATLFLMDSGERFCSVIDKTTGIPLHYPNVYLITDYRNQGKSVSTIELVAGSIAILYNFALANNINITERIMSQSFLAVHEIDLLRDYVSRRTKLGGVSGIRKLNNLSVRTATKNFRITYIAKYLEWLCHIILMDLRHNKKKIDYFITQIKKRKAVVKKRNALSYEDKSLDKEQVKCLLRVIQLGSELNPFNLSVQKRNRLIILLLYSLGIRCGELLNIKISDIDFQDGSLYIRRRADEKTDPRLRQPLVKTLERRITLSEILIKDIHDYILNDRRKFKRARKHEYLFVTHKAGPTQGIPVTRSTYHGIINDLRNSMPDIGCFTGHQLRHTWNNMFSEITDEDNEIGYVEQEKARSYHMGWRPESKTSSVYNERFIRDKAGEFSLLIQKRNLTPGGQK